MFNLVKCNKWCITLANRLEHVSLENIGKREFGIMRDSSAAAWYKTYQTTYLQHQLKAFFFRGQ